MCHVSDFDHLDDAKTYARDGLIVRPANVGQNIDSKLDDMLTEITRATLAREATVYYIVNYIGARK